MRWQLIHEQLTIRPAYWDRPDKKKEVMSDKKKKHKNRTPKVGRFWLHKSSREWTISIDESEAYVGQGDIILVRKANDELVLVQLGPAIATSKERTLYEFEVMKRRVTEEELIDVGELTGKQSSLTPMPDLAGEGITRIDAVTDKALAPELRWVAGELQWVAVFEHGGTKTGAIIDIEGYRCEIGALRGHKLWADRKVRVDGMVGRPEFEITRMWKLPEKEAEKSSSHELHKKAHEQFIQSSSAEKAGTKMAKKETTTATSVIMGAIGVASADELVDFAARRLARLALKRGNVELAEAIIGSTAKEMGKAALACTLLGAATALAAPDENGDVSDIGTVAGLFIEPLKGAATAGLGVLVKEGLHGFSAFSQEDEKDLVAAIEAAKESRKEEQKEVKELRSVAAQAKAQKTM